jgi:hypothetical protein
MTQIYDHWPENATCPLCNTKEDDKCILVPTRYAENKQFETVEAVLVHIKCIQRAVHILSNAVIEDACQFTQTHAIFPL